MTNVDVAAAMVLLEEAKKKAERKTDANDVFRLLSLAKECFIRAQKWNGDTKLQETIQGLLAKCKASKDTDMAQL